ncbi:flagellar biosynthetic protein FliO [Phenylobacterium sp.]|jgi:flagellar protein FliO/FliZ|uniref:flagellar biosynthetic protein FliO n=1 Tax=Phenylobacterium sp. TaxID=1871053 RepID=UPI002F934761
MDLSDLARAIFALALTLGIIGLAAVALRKFGPDALARLARPTRRERRLAVVENLVLDPTRRLVLVSCDGQEMLLLLGEGRVLAEGVAQPAADAR